MQNQTFQLMVDGVPYSVSANPFTFNEGIRYEVKYNESATKYVFAWDDSAKQYMAIDQDSADIPSNVETAIAQKLERLNAKISL